ncbi:MAG: ABC transporter ATP-binding protein, partial [Clostridia bacterium]|nr:ABC transporter ATP-binding protein [Clostridia bacterium]
MVFLLGKSGSGKSTLLKVCGGLDNPTEGEIIVKGRSSKNFSQSDFDSYRNTYVGFIFQEYHILNEFTVEENIALALELQGKRKDKQVIEDILSQVELEGSAARKPNTLSGGQKQRIAIARALVKNPEIIMADEPTGALDSATGKQVFDTLKKLSKEKLVIVVSHDRDFAEQYADRIIELKDGKVISDVTKSEPLSIPKQAAATSENKKPLNPAFSLTPNGIRIEKGATLTEDDFTLLRNYILNAENDVVLSGGNASLFQSAAPMSEATGENLNNVFVSTAQQPQAKTYTAEESKFIRSHLPIAKAAKIGVAGVKVKPVRLVFTILLSVIAFVMFGLVSTMTFYSSYRSCKASLMRSGYTSVYLEKNYMETTTYYTSDGDVSYTTERKHPTKFTAEDLNDFNKTFNNGAMGVVECQTTFNNLILEESGGFPDYFVPSSYGGIAKSVGYVDENSSWREGMIGAYPQADDEIAISSYLAEGILRNTLFNPETNEAYVLNKADDLIGKKIMTWALTYTGGGAYVDYGDYDDDNKNQNNGYTITGIFLA